AREELRRIRQNRPVISLAVTAGKEEDPEIFAGLSWTIGFNRRQQLEINRIKVDQGERAVRRAETAVEDRVAAALADFELERQAMDWLELQWQEAERTYRGIDRKSTRLNSSHVKISYAVFCLKKTTMTNS